MILVFWYALVFNSLQLPLALYFHFCKWKSLTKFLVQALMNSTEIWVAQVCCFVQTSGTIGWQNVIGKNILVFCNIFKYYNAQNSKIFSHISMCSLSKQYIAQTKYLVKTGIFSQKVHTAILAFLLQLI